MKIVTRVALMLTAVVTVAATVVTVTGTVTRVVPLAAQASATVYRCYHIYSPYDSYTEVRAPLPHRCNRGYVLTPQGPGTKQVITVTDPSSTGTYARFIAWGLANGKWSRAFGPWTARVGASGMAAPGKKIEGDALTPQGTYGFSFMFGVNASPGVHYTWRHAYSYDYWDDDPASSRYNLWTDTRYYSAGKNPEPMHNVPAYDYAAVIAYNTARVPGAGSAIFLHVGTGSATAGCVSLPTTELLDVLRWLSPKGYPRITMKVAS